MRFLCEEDILTTGHPSSSFSTAPVRIFLLDDHEVVRRGVRDLLEAEPGIVVVGEAANAREALARVPAARPDVAVLDVRLGGATGGDHEGVEVRRELRAELSDLACLMLTSFDDDEALFDAIMAGAAGYVLNQIGGLDLVAVIRTMATDRSLLDPRNASRPTRLQPPTTRGHSQHFSSALTHGT